MKLLEWLKSFFSKKEQVNYNVFNPQERNIYHYLKGEKEGLVHIDPMILEKRLAELKEELMADLKVVRSPVAPKEWRDKRYVLALEKIRKIFDVKEFAEGGLLEEELLPLLDHFLLFTETVKKNSRIYLTSVVETSQGSEPSKDLESAISSSSDSGSIEKEPSTEQQEVLPTVQESPLASTSPLENTTSPLPMEQQKQT